MGWSSFHWVVRAEPFLQFGGFSLRDTLLRGSGRSTSRTIPISFVLLAAPIFRGERVGCATWWMAMQGGRVSRATWKLSMQGASVGYDVEIEHVRFSGRSCNMEMEHTRCLGRLRRRD
ncbi:hypothetical protein Pyn_12618 [Prunus yedoensis var. nudiflora]|uniref:Uncharacterized protein n=1 Tax=Prunus yedoensis var. nudiflora TaxID=2094558 RepID=A0A314Z923_PRUYE|nr:hypothetical protein Pyn_12618 [Prunus yedoensis var. nudiflora]